MPAIIYKNAAGERIPGVTTVLGNLGWSRDALMWWSWNEGINGRNYRETRDVAADAGTLAHAMIEADLKGLDPYGVPRASDIGDTDIEEKATNAYHAWEKWKELVSFKLISSELSCVSELHQFGGTLDIAMVMDKPSITDVKTGKGIYPSMRIQVAAYQSLYNEIYPEPIEDCYILRLGKEDGSFSHHFYPSLDNEWEVFLHLLELHRLKKIIGK